MHAGDSHTRKTLSEAVQIQEKCRKEWKQTQSETEKQGMHKQKVTGK